MDPEDYQSRIKRELDLARAASEQRDRLGLSDSHLVQQMREASRHTALASDYLREIRGFAADRGIRQYTEGVSRRDRLTDVLHGSNSAVARAAMGSLNDPALKAVMMYGGSLAPKAAHELLSRELSYTAWSAAGERAMALAREAATYASGLELASALAGYRASEEMLASRLGMFASDQMLRDRGVLESFARSAAMSNALTAGSRVDGQRQCQEFRVRAGIEGKKETRDVPMQRACNTK